MLGWRLLISAFLIPALVGVFVLDHRAGQAAPYLLALCLLLGLRSVYEMTDLLRARSFGPRFVPTALCTLAVIAAGWMGNVDGSAPTSFAQASAVIGPIGIAYGLSILILLLSEAVAFRGPGRSIETLGAELLTVSYIGVLMGLTVQLRWTVGADAGYLALGSLVIAAKCGDTGAYTLGRLFGRSKMMPRLSPGKTWMGALGAVLGASLGAILWFQLATPRFNPGWEPCHWYWSLLYGALIGVAGLVGDLCESLIKRDVGRKDSARLLPGMGGLLDLLDSILFAGPIAWILWQVLPLATWR